MAIQFSKLNNQFFVIDPDITNNHGDNTINGSISWALSQGSGTTVKLLPGQYTTTEAITFVYDNCNIIGSSKDSIIYMNQTNDDYIIDLASKDNLSLENFQILGTNAGAHSKFMIHSTDASDNLNINNIYANNADFGFLNIYGCSNVVITNCIIESIEDSYAFNINSSNNVNISNNVILGEYGILFTAVINSIISNNSINASVANAIFINNSDYNNITGNNIKTSAAITNGLIYLNSGDHNNIVGNYISGNTGGEGIKLVTSDNNNIQSNLIYSMSTYGINVSNVGSNDNTIINNNCVTCTSGNYIDSGTGTKIQQFDGTDLYINNPFQSRQIAISEKSADYTILSSDLGKSFRSKRGANNNFTLPIMGADDDGARLTFIKGDEFRLTITSVDSVTIADSSGPGTIYEDTAANVGASITIEYYHSITKFCIISGSGTWVTT